MSEVIVVEAVSDKFKNKYSSGSVLAGGKWLQVSSKLSLADFKKDSQVTVETKTNDKGYVSIVSLIKEDVKEPVEQMLSEVKQRHKKSKEADAITETRSYDEIKNDYYIRNGYGKPMSQYEIDLDRRISRAGIIQAVVQSPMLAGLPFTNPEEAVELVKTVSEALIVFVDEQTK